VLNATQHCLLFSLVAIKGVAMVKPWKLIAQNPKGAFPIGEFVNLQDAEARQRFAEKAMPQLNFWVMFEYPENYPMAQKEAEPQ
jgi:hypothetical protein